MVVTGAGSGTSAEIGFSSALETLKGLAAEFATNYIAVAIRGTVPVAGAKIYMGDASFSNYYEITINTNDVNAVVDIGDGWKLLVADATDASVVTTTGTPTVSGAKRMKVTFFSYANVAAGTVWLGYAGVVKKPKATVVLTADDAYAEWYNYLFPAMAERGIPGSFSIDAGYLDKTGFMTQRQLRNALEAYGEFIEYVNHGANNLAYTGANLAAYTDNIIKCDNLLKELGVPEASRKLHTYVQGQFDQSLVDWLVAAGYTSARQVGASDRSQFQIAAHLSAADTSRNSLYGIPAGCNLEIAQPLDTVIGYIEKAKARGTVFFLMGHEFKAAPGAQAYVAGYHATHGMSNLLDYLAAERDAGRIDLMKWSEYRQSFGIGRAVTGVTVLS